MNEARLPKLSTEAHEAIALLLMMGWKLDTRTTFGGNIRYIDPPVDVLDRLREAKYTGRYIDISKNSWGFLQTYKLRPSDLVHVITTCPVEEWRYELGKVGRAL